MVFSSFRDAHLIALRKILLLGKKVENTVEVLGIRYIIEQHPEALSNWAWTNKLDIDYVNNTPAPDFHSAYLPSLEDILTLFKNKHPSPDIPGNLNWREDPYDLNTRQAVYVSRPDSKRPDHLPCIVTAQFIAREGKLHLFLFQRSGEMLRKVPRDYLAWRYFQRTVAHALGVSVGTLTHQIVSAHVMQEDIPEVKRRLI